jgi:hypothetical protein
MNNHDIGLISLAAIFGGFVALGLIIAFWTKLEVTFKKRQESQKLGKGKDSQTGPRP